ncbi:hypothetical protein ACJ2A9_13385 [Anaerobacillus sp. MEB173]|uniref:hypothetical protein n=1 Tax=Anaerobacillus sp. MEB173 TaxID=3383345 RepID=UPI003F90976E
MNVKEIIDFNLLRKEKQQIADRTLCSLYEEYFSYLETSINLREKVRAKHMFYHKVGVPFQELHHTKWKLQFEHWLAFDYVTVMGHRMFDQFIREYSHQLPKPMLEMSSFLFLMTLEPILIEKVNDRHKIEGRNPLFGKSSEIQSLHFPFTDITKGDLIFLRQTRAGFKQVAIGPHTKIKKLDSNRLMQLIQADYEKVNKRKPHTSWRAFLKEFGIHYLKFAETL